MDRIQAAAVVASLGLDAMVLAAMATQIGDLGFTPNRTAALGPHLVRLSRVGCLQVEWRALPESRRRYYALTDAGRSA